MNVNFFFPMIEIISYTFLFGISAFGVLGASASKQENSAIFFLAYFGLVLSIRISGLEGDLLTYSNEMKGNSLEFYYLREPVLWFFHRFLFNLTGNEIVTFICSDAIIGLLLWRASSILNLSQFDLLLLLTSFFAILFMQNIYRQWFGTVIFVYALGSFKNDNVKSSYIIFIISILTHNSLLLFGPLIVKNSYLKIISLLTLPMVFLLGAPTKSGMSTGLELGTFLFLIFTAAALSYVINLKSLTMYLGNKHLDIICLIVIGFLALFFLSSASSERIIYSALFIFCFVTGSHVVRRRDFRIVKVFVGCLFYLVSYAGGSSDFLI